MASLSFLRGEAARCAHNSPAIGGRIPHLRAEKCFFLSTFRPKKRLEFISRLRTRKSATLCAVRGAGSLFSAREGRKCGGWWMGDAAPIWVRGPVCCQRQQRRHGGFCLFVAGGDKCGSGVPVCRRRRQRRQETVASLFFCQVGLFHFAIEGADADAEGLGGAGFAGAVPAVLI